MLQVDADEVHDDVGQHSKNDADEGNKDDGQKREIKMALVVEVRPPCHNTCKFSRIGHQNDGLAASPRVGGVSASARRVAAFEETFGRSLMIVALVFLLIAGTLAFAMIFNTARTVFDERRRELATLRVIGMTRAETAYILVAELAVVTLLALPAGLALGYGLAAVLAAAMRSELFRLPVILEAHSYARAAILLIAAAAVSMAWSAWDLARLDVKEALAARD